MEVQHVKSHPRGGEWNQYLKILIAIPSPQNETAGNLPLTLTFHCRGLLDSNFTRNNRNHLYSFVAEAHHREHASPAEMILLFVSNERHPLVWTAFYQTGISSNS
eukprot:scaffold8318_cov55-Cyclotella_meneghiniana.AAC.1